MIHRVRPTGGATPALDRTRLVAARLSLVGSCLALVLLGMVYRLFQKSVLEHGVYAALASNQHTIRQELPSQRGVVMIRGEDRGRWPLATNERRYDVSVIPNRVTDAKGLASALAPILGLDANEIFATIDNQKPYLPPLKERVDEATVTKVASLPFKGILTIPVETRTYPERELAAQLIGFVNHDGLGAAGLEAQYDDALQGKSGTLLGQQDTFGRLVSITGQVKPQPGSQLVLTIDHTIQFLVERQLAHAVKAYGAGGGSAIVMDPKTGAILALANQPSFDPNHYNQVPAEEQQRYLNHAVSAIYEPGSIMKPVVMAIAIDEGKVAPDTKSVFGNVVTVQGYQIHTALDKAYGEETMTQVLENSDNVGMVWVAGHLEYETLFDRFKRFGFGAPSGIDLPAETTGSVLPLGDWRDISRANMAFGQGISVTPLQMMLAWQSLVNGGQLMKPYVVDEIRRPDGSVVTTKPTVVRQTVSQATADKVRLMLQSVVDNGQSKKAQIPGYSIGGKTGTAQYASPTGGYIEDSYNHSYVGFFPVESPQYLVMVQLDHPTSSIYADATALPTFRAISQGIISYASLLPDRPAPTP